MISFKKMLDLLFGANTKSSKTTAKDRLQFILMHDRADISPHVMEQIRQDILAVLSKHLDIDETQLEVNLERAEGTVALVANIPIRRVLSSDSTSKTL